MGRVLTRPQDPDGFARLIGAMRAYTGERKPQSNAERAAIEAMRAQGVSSDLVRAMVTRLDATRASVRTHYLGETTALDFALPEPIHAAGPTAAPTMVTVPSLALRDLLHLAPIPPHPAPPVYTLRYRGVYCHSETSWDGFSNSDEIYLVTSAVHIDASGQNVVRTERMPVGPGDEWYGDVDSGEVRVGPTAACWHGNSDPVSLTVAVFEYDNGNPDAYKAEIDAAVKAAIAIAAAYYAGVAILEKASGLISDAINWLIDTGDDLIQTQTVVNPRSILEWYAGHTVSVYVDHNKSTSLPFHFITTHHGGGATYIAGFDVTREPPLPLPPPVIP